MIRKTNESSYAWSPRGRELGGLRHERYPLWLMLMKPECNVQQEEFAKKKMRKMR